jgi:protein-tyrosine phosphatase
MKINHSSNNIFNDNISNIIKNNSVKNQNNIANLMKNDKINNNIANLSKSTSKSNIFLNNISNNIIDNNNKTTNKSITIINKENINESIYSSHNKNINNENVFKISINNNIKNTNIKKTDNNNFQINRNIMKNNNSTNLISIKKKSPSPNHSSSSLDISDNESFSNNNSPSCNKTSGTTKIIVINEASKVKRTNRLRARGKSLLLDVPKKECSICSQLIETHLLKIHFNSHPSQIFNWMFLGTFLNACDINELRRIGIQFILNCAAECQNFNLPEDIKELHLNIRDEKNFSLIDFFDEANTFINKVRLSGNIILIHCKFGISRSVSFIIAYLVKYFGYTVINALNYIKKKRKQINPNQGFLDQLVEYERITQEKEKERKKNKS